MKKIFMALCSLAACLSMNGQANLQIENFSIDPGESKTITLDLVNPSTEVSGFNCIIMLPEGLTVNKKSNGKYNISFNKDSERNVSHTISIGEKDGGISIVVMSLEADALEGVSGDPVLDIPVTASAEMEPGTYEIKVAKQDLTNCTGTQTYKPEDYVCTVTVEGTSTSVTSVRSENNNEAIFNLNGQKLNSANHGVNIINGKKVLVK